jgi:hypothetical protein
VSNPLASPLHLSFQWLLVTFRIVQSCSSPSSWGLRPSQDVSERLRLRVDTAQAAAVLTMLEARQAGREPSQPDWNHLFATEGYMRLEARERGMRRAFTDSAFKAFVLSDTLRARAGALRQALTEWGRADLDAAAARALAYLPHGARLAATIYIVIKPQTNSFVWDLSTNPAVFLYLDPNVPAPKLENTMAHELHHIGLGANDAQADSLVQAMPDSVQLAATWIGAFGEGFAMLAAAGGTDVHAHAVSDEDERRRWDQDVARFNDDLRTLDEFFLNIIAGRFPPRTRCAASRRRSTERRGRGTRSAGGWRPSSKSSWAAPS